MAKKVTIEGSNKLSSLTDPWGGQAGNSAETHYGTSVPAGAEWGMNRGEVERFIKAQFGSKVSYFHRTDDNMLLGFASEDDYLAWVSDPENNPPVTSSTLPSMVNEDVYQVRAILEAVPNEIQRSRDVSINVKGTSIVQLAVGGTEAITESLNVIIETSPTGNAGTWTSRIAGTINANSDTYKTFSLESYLSLGTNYVRVRVSGQQATSIPVSFTLNIVNLYLTPVTDFSNLPTETLELSYLIGGSINKTIQFEFGTGRGDTFVSSYSTAVNLGEQTWAQTARTFQFTEASLLAAGRHSVRARLWVNSNVYTDWVESEYMVAGSSAMVVVNNIQTGLSNWTAVKFFDWALFTPNGEGLSVVFKLYDELDENVYGTWNFSAENNETYSFTTQLALNIAENISLFAGNMHIEDSEGNTLAPSVPFVFTNSAEYAPVSGADFVMLPSNRNNSETNKATIINEAGSTPVVVNSNFIGFGWLNDGWIDVQKDLEDEEQGTLRALHIPAGHKVEIEYNPFSDFTGNSNAGRNATFEIDFRTSNILDTDEAIVRIGTLVNDKIWGFEMLPTKAYMMTEENRTIEDQDADWSEDVRTHLAVNIVSVIYSQTKTLNYVRIFINGIIEREFLYTTSDRFTAASGVKIELGNTSSDLDVFGIRNYKTSLTTSDVMRNYRASMDTIDEKLAFKEKNDITLNEQISFSRCIALGYNVIGHTGPLPKYGKADGNPTYTGVSLRIHIEGDEEHSGILTDLEAKGQGTTAMGYYDWNQSYKITGTTKHLTEAGVQKEGSAYADGKGYSIAENEYAAKKLVGKINFASSMQSHKLGLTWIFTEVFKELVNQNKMSKPSQLTSFPNARIAVFEKPFLFFHRETENDEWTYKYLMTFGAGKGDKPTFGFDKNATGDMLMVEGADNDPALCNFARPWDDSIIYNPSKEAWYDGSTKSINFGFGKTAEVNGEEYPSSTNAINAIKAFWNFVFEHHTGITFYTGTLENLQAGLSYVEGNKQVRTRDLYWIANDTSVNAQRYDLFRYSNGTWVAAGANETTLNLREQYKTFNNGTYPSWSGKTNIQINNEIKAIRRAHFKANAETYFHVDDALYHSCFVKLFAGTDNRAKNTYYYTDPETLKIRWMQDDLDTVIKTNNLGQNRKPYYVEEHDTDGTGATYWQGEGNGFYNLLEEVYCDVTDDQNDRMPAMMREMLSVMSSKGGNVMGYLLQRLLFVQDYFPAIAYNEQARLVYETAQAAQTGSNPDYTHSIQAITQSCGSQRWSEFQWLKDRIMYISSWCEFGEFASGTNTAGALSFRSDAGDFNFRLTPAKWMYPRVGKGTSRIPAKNDNSVLISRVRVEPKTTFNYLGFTSEGDTDVYIRGIDYLLDIGDMNVYLKPAAFGFHGRRLQQINVNPNGTDANHLAASSITNTATNIKSFVLRNVSTVAGTLDLSKCYRLETIDIRGSLFSGITLPQTERLTSLMLPSSLTTLYVDNTPNLATLTMEGVSNLTKLRVTGSPLVSTYPIVNALKTANAPISEIVLHDINWTNVDAALVEWLTTIPTCELTGTISISNAVSFDLRAKMFAKWSNIGSGLTITYDLVNILSMQMSGDSYISETGTYQYRVAPYPSNGNNFSSISWEVDWNGNGPKDIAQVASIDATGLLTVYEVFSSDAAKIKVSAIVGGVEVSKVVGLYYREAEVGDLVFADGTWSDTPDPYKTIIGVCFLNEERVINDVTKRLRLMVAMKDITGGNGTGGSWKWGLYNSSPTDSISLSSGYGVYNTPLVDSEAPQPSSYNITLDSSNQPIVNSEGTQFNDYWRADFKVLEVTSKLSGKDGVQWYGYTEGDIVPHGLRDTLYLIRHRDYVVDALIAAGKSLQTLHGASVDGNYIGVDLAAVKNAIATAPSSWDAAYYPAASLCFSYEPTGLKDGEVLNPKFKRNHWWLPSLTESIRLKWWLKGYLTKASTEGATLGVNKFATAFANGLTNLVTTNNDWYEYWVCRELDNTYCNYFNNARANTYYYGRSTKSGNRQVRAICMF